MLHILLESYGFVPIEACIEQIKLVYKNRIT